MPKASVLDKFKRISDEEFQSLIHDSKNMKALASRLGMQNSHYYVLRARVASGKFNFGNWPIQTVSKITRLTSDEIRAARPKHSANNGLLKFESEVLPLMFVENCSLDPRRFRQLVILWNSKFGWLDYKCQLCGNTGSHNDQVLVLQLDHKNGASSDNRLENLRFLCPNCHSQTDTFCGRNIAKRNRAARIQALEAIL